jgi:hypothetical protein
MFGIGMSEIFILAIILGIVIGTIKIGVKVFNHISKQNKRATKNDITNHVKTKEICPELPLLNIFLSKVNEQTQKQQSERFAGIKANFEFATWVSIIDVEKIVEESMQRGFTVWCNTDSAGAFLYGAIMTGDDITQHTMWLSHITVKGEKCQVFFQKKNSKLKSIKIEGGMF